MSEETYELCLDGEGLRIIPVGDDQVSVHILTEDASGGILTGDQVSILGQEDALEKTLGTPLFLPPAQPILVQRSQPVHNVHQPVSQKKTLLQPISLYIDYGSNWIEDVLFGMKELPQLRDFPVYCSDGISWTSRLILGSLNAKLRSMLTSAGDDSCLVLPQINKLEFDTFTEYILHKDVEIDKETMKKLLKVGEFFEFPIKYISLEDQNNNNSMISYATIFTKQREEFIHKISRQADLAKFISEVCTSPVHTVPAVHTQPWNQYNTTDLSEFDKENENWRLECHDCRRLFPSEDALKTHVSIVHSDIRSHILKKVHRCPCCPKMFAFKPNVEKHMKLVHRKKLAQVVTASPPSPMYLSPPSTPPPQRVKIVPKVKKTVQETSTQISCAQCGELVKNKRAMVSHMQKHFGRLHKCDVKGCTASFTEFSKLKRHMVVHTGEKKFECSICNTRFTLSHNLKNHIKHHQKEGKKPKKQSFLNFVADDLEKRLDKNLPRSSGPPDLSVDLSKTTDDIEKFIAAMEGEEL